MTSEGTRVGDDRAGTVMTRWGMPLSWLTHFSSRTGLRPAPSWVTPSAVMAGLDLAILTR
jgi:hypothetical protein